MKQLKLVAIRIGSVFLFVGQKFTRNFVPFSHKTKCAERQLFRSTACFQQKKKTTGTLCVHFIRPIVHQILLTEITIGFIDGYGRAGDIETPVHKFTYNKMMNRKIFRFFLLLFYFDARQRTILL